MFLFNQELLQAFFRISSLLFQVTQVRFMKGFIYQSIQSLKIFIWRLVQSIVIKMKIESSLFTNSFCSVSFSSKVLDSKDFKVKPHINELTKNVFLTFSLNREKEQIVLTF